MVATYHYDAKTSPACVVGERSRPLEGSGVGTGVCAPTARRSIRTSVEGELEICECADIDGGCNWKVICMGLHSGCRGQMVRPCLVHFLGSPLLLLSILPFLLPKKTYSCTLGMGGCGLYSGLFLKENGEWKHFSGDLFVSLLRGTPCRVPCPCVATEIEGTFRVNGSNKRMRDLQAVFETPPRVRISFSPFPNYCRRDILVWQVA
jgi:hypothetical protein